jgi:hypothetical protein
VAMWRRTTAQLRNRPRLDSWPVEVQCAHTKRVTPPPHPSPLALLALPATGTGAALASLAMITTAASNSVWGMDLIAYRATGAVSVGSHVQPLSKCRFERLCTGVDNHRLGSAQGHSKKKSNCCMRPPQHLLGRPISCQLEW